KRDQGSPTSQLNSFVPRGDYLVGLKPNSPGELASPCQRSSGSKEISRSARPTRRAKRVARRSRPQGSYSFRKMGVEWVCGLTNRTGANSGALEMPAVAYRC